MNNKKKTSLGIIALVMLTFGITSVKHHANDSSDVMEAESVDESVGMVDEDYDRIVFFNKIQEDEQQRLMNDRLKLEQERVDKAEADRQAEIKLAEEARLEEERKEAERVAQVEREAQAEENRIKEAERVAQAEREAQAQTTTASQTSTQPAATQKSTPAPAPAQAPKPAPAPQQPAPQPVIGPNKIGINGVYKSYTNYGASDTATVQSGIDNGLIVAALTHFNPSDGQTTYFGGHNPGVMNFMASNMYHGAIVTVTDSNGNPHRYKMVDHVNADTSGSTVFQSIGHSAVSVYAYGSNEESILIQFCNTSNPLMSLWYGVPVN